VLRYGRSLRAGQGSRLRLVSVSQAGLGFIYDASSGVRCVEPSPHAVAVTQIWLAIPSRAHNDDREAGGESCSSAPDRDSRPPTLSA